MALPISCLQNASGYRFLGMPRAPFSEGVVALPGYRLIRATLRQPCSLAEALPRIASYLGSQEHPLASLAGLELRAPRVMTRQEFRACNRDYLSALRQYGFLATDNVSIARSNVVPLSNPPETHHLLAFTWAAKSDEQTDFPDFLLSGCPEYASGPDRVIAAGDNSETGMAQKALFVFRRLEEHVERLGSAWSRASCVQIYTRDKASIAEKYIPGCLKDIQPNISFLRCLVPVEGFSGASFEFEADMRAVREERII